MSFVIFDTEYTSWKGCQENGWQGSQRKEIVQMAAIKISERLEVTDSFNGLCKPVLNPVLSDYFVDLTHITNEQIEKMGRPFQEIYDIFAKFVGEDICYSHSWGADYANKSDGEVIKENIELYKLPAHKDLVYRNIAPIFKQLYAENEIDVKSQSSGQIAEILNLGENIKKLGLNQHNALYDVYSILVGLKYFYPRSVELMSCFENSIL